MSEYEPDDSRDVTQSSHQAPGEPPRTGFREDGARLRSQAEQGEVPQREQSQQGQQAANDGYATEGDAPGHPDRFADSVPEQEQQSQQQQQQQQTQAASQKPDRWRQAADDENYTPEGK
jgi:hypothetical protein